MSDEDLICNLLVLFNASFVTTIHLIGNGMRLLLDQPALRPLAENPAFVEEVLRYEAPVQFVGRFASEEAEVVDTVIPPKELVLVMLGAANRDARRYPAPDTLMWGVPTQAVEFRGRAALLPRGRAGSGRGADRLSPIAGALPVAAVRQTARPQSAAVPARVQVDAGGNMTADEILALLQTDEGRRAPYPLYERLHELGPVNLTPASPAYAAVANGYAAVDQILRDPRFVKGGPPPAADADPITTALSNSMMFRTEPDHGRMRRAFHAAFTPRRVQELEPQIVALTDSLLDRLAAFDGPVDFIAEFGYLLPAGVMSALLGIPAPDLDWFRTRVQRVEDYLDFGGRTPQKVAAANEAAVEMSTYYAAADRCPSALLRATT